MIENTDKIIYTNNICLTFFILTKVKTSNIFTTINFKLQFQVKF